MLMLQIYNFLNKRLMLLSISARVNPILAQFDGNSENDQCFAFPLPLGRLIVETQPVNSLATTAKNACAQRQHK